MCSRRRPCGTKSLRANAAIKMGWFALDLLCPRGLEQLCNHDTIFIIRRWQQRNGHGAQWRIELKLRQAIHQCVCKLYSALPQLTAYHFSLFWLKMALGIAHTCKIKVPRALRSAWHPFLFGLMLTKQERKGKEERHWRQTDRQTGNTHKQQFMITLVARIAPRKRLGSLCAWSESCAEVRYKLMVLTSENAGHFLNVSATIDETWPAPAPEFVMPAPFVWVISRCSVPCFEKHKNIIERNGTLTRVV